MPNIFAVDANGKIAEGCRAVEALRIIHDLDMMFDNLRSARKRIREGIVLSEETKKEIKKTVPLRKALFVLWSERVITQCVLRNTITFVSMGRRTSA